MTNYPLSQILQKPKVSGRFLKWAIDLSQFDICHRIGTTIKGQALTDFITEFTYSNTTEVVRTTNVVKARKEVKMERIVT